jgi:hypothetical protein
VRFNILAWEINIRGSQDPPRAAEAMVIMMMIMMNLTSKTGIQMLSLTVNKSKWIMG